MKKVFILLAIMLLFQGIVYAAPALNKFELQADTRGNHNTLIPNVSKWVDAKVLAAGVAESITVPTDAKMVIFSANNDFYINSSGGTAATPSADVSDGSASELNPSVRYVYGQGTISIISPYTRIITLSYYK